MPYKVDDDNQVRLNFDKTRSRVIRGIEHRLISGLLEMASQEGSALVADFLQSFPVRGVIGDCNRCALAEWVRAIVTAEIHDFEAYSVEMIAVDQEAIRVRIGYHGPDEGYEIQLPIPMDSPVMRFVAEFDDGAYPYLIDREDAE